jgi:predicted ABC-type ATPase
MARPVIYVLAGVNGAGKSSIGGAILRSADLEWFNPDTFARETRHRLGCTQTAANAHAWTEGQRRLRRALADGRSFAFETTLGGRTVPTRIAQAHATHDVFVWFIGLDGVDRHLARVRLRVAHGGHDIPAPKIRERFARAPLNLIALLPHITRLQVYDNSSDVAPGESVPDPHLVLDVRSGRVHYPDAADAAALTLTPPWARPIVEAALRADSGGRTKD